MILKVMVFDDRVPFLPFIAMIGSGTKKSSNTHWGAVILFLCFELLKTSQIQ